MGEGSASDVERPRLGNDIYKHPLRPQLPVTDPTDGLPRMASTVSMEDTKAPTLDPETFVCMGDESVFVIRDQWGEVALAVAPDRVRRRSDAYGNHYWSIARDQVSDEDRATLAKRGLLDKVKSSEPLDVEPIRPQCGFYRRVMTDFEGNDKHRSVERVCAAQRTEGGEYVALGNTRVFACEHRSPRDFVSEERLRKFDADRVAEGKKAEEEWDGEQALADALKTPGKKT